uniref:Uncharacterized protein n=1 Tax=Theileria parva TaxID=5875 RepID=Q4N3N2_THEPA|eukprot:XP_765524.1 hypothetical protein [Theileria parva strain Muguga]
MTTEDYEESSPETSISKYVFKSKLEQFYCDDEVIYTRKPEGKYCKCLTYNNINEFGEFFRVFTKEGERYKILFTRKR